MMKNIEEELRKAYDMMTPEQMEENISDIETAPLSSDSEQRIKNMIKEKMGKTGKKGGEKAVRRWIAAAAAFVIVLAGVTAFSSENVRAAVAKLFGFVPGVGVIEVDEEDTAADSVYILDGTSETSDEMVSLDIKSAVIMGDKLELRYTAYLKKITDKDLEKNINTLSDMYFEKGYNKYFAVSTLEEDMYQPLTPITSAAFNGTEITPYNTKVTETESLESARSVCISQFYDLSSMAEGEEMQGVLTLGDLSVDFAMRKIDLDSSAEGAAGGTAVSIGGVKMLCRPQIKEDRLYIDYYVLDKGGYKEVYGVRGFGNKTDCLTVAYEEIYGWIDEACIFESEGGMFAGRFVYDLGGYEEKKAELSIYGMYVKKDFEDKGIFFEDAPERKQTLNKTLDFDGITAEIAEMSVKYYGEEQGYEENENGYLVLRYSVKDSNDVCFTNFAEISVNGEGVEGFYVNGYDLEYCNLVIPLPIPFEEIRAVEFESINLMLSGEASIDIPLQAE